MHLLLLNYEFPPLGAGAGNATRMLAREFVALGHQVSVMTTWYPGLPDVENVEGYTVYRVHAWRRRRDRSNIFEMMHYVYLANRAAILLAYSKQVDHTIAFFALPTGLIAWCLYRKFKIPYTLSLRGGDVPGFLPKDLRFHHLLTRPLNRAVWGNAKHIVANSDGLQDLAQKTAGMYGKSVLYIPNGVDTDLYHPGEMQKETSRRSLLFVGRLVRQKGVTYIIKALAKLRTAGECEGTMVHLTIVGDGPLRGSLMREAKECGVSDMITWLGWLDREQLSYEYRKHDVFIFPSFEEGMPNALLEAMASGLAVLATEIPGITTIVEAGKEGLLIRSQDLLDKAIEELCGMPMLHYKRSARIKAEQFMWSSVARSYQQYCL